VSEVHAQDLQSAPRPEQHGPQTLLGHLEVRFPHHQRAVLVALFVAAVRDCEGQREVLVGGEATIVLVGLAVAAVITPVVIVVITLNKIYQPVISI
jgi:hypothetical protein